MFSTNTVLPADFSSAAISAGCASVGKPGYGAVRTGRIALSLPSLLSVTASPSLTISQPASASAPVTVESWR